MTTFSGTRGALAEADKKIAKLEEQIIQLRVHRNAIVPINRIPRELLQEIMHYVRGEDEMHDNDEERFRLEKLDQVCQHWRDVALNYPVLWAKIQLQSPGFSIMWLKELLRRSRSSPLSIKFCPQGMYAVREFIKCVHGHRHRVRTLGVHDADHDTELTNFSQWLMEPKEWPALESLRLNQISDGAIKKQSMVLPKLRSLTLVSYCDPNLLAPTLQDLQITRMKPGLELNRIFRLLSLLPNLQNLKLAYALNEVENIDWDGYTLGQGPIQLPALRALALCSRLSNTIAAFLSRITLHDGVALRLHFWEGHADSFLDNVVCKALEMKPASTCIPSGFNLGIDGYSGITLTLSTPHNDEICFSAQIPLHDDEFFCVTISKLPLENIKSCTVNTLNWGRGMERQLHGFSTGSNLEVMRVECCTERFVEFSHSMAERMPQCGMHRQDSASRNGFYPCSECHKSGKSFFPALRRIVLQNSLFQGSYIDRMKMVFPNPLLAFFGRRIRCRLRIEEVFIDDAIRLTDLAWFRRKFAELHDDLGPYIVASRVIEEINEAGDGKRGKEGSEERNEESSSHRLEQE